ncbi:hypothetical protein ABIB82_006474 [Bradyrhizobium sp. i1.8.4]|uniref:hypothetical protein n=1 Tax=unclassified Bradyrhizobium TaxID=2631580 RepID=UPI003D231544
MKYPITRFKSMEIALKEMEPFVKNGTHLQTGKPFKQLSGMRSREVLANWLLCATINAVDKRELMFSSDPIGSDGIIQDGATGQTWPTEHVLVPRQSAADGLDAKALILNAIEQKRGKGGAAYASGKMLVVLLDAGAGEWFPNKVARELPSPLHFAVGGRGLGIVGRSQICGSARPPEGDRRPQGVHERCADRRSGSLRDSVDYFAG